MIYGKDFTITILELDWGRLHRSKKIIKCKNCGKSWTPNKNANLKRVNVRRCHYCRTKSLTLLESKNGNLKESKSLGSGKC